MSRLKATIGEISGVRLKRAPDVFYIRRTEPAQDDEAAELTPTPPPSSPRAREAHRRNEIAAEFRAASRKR